MTREVSDSPTSQSLLLLIHPRPNSWSLHYPKDLIITAIIPVRLAQVGSLEADPKVHLHYTGPWEIFQGGNVFRTSPNPNFQVGYADIRIRGSVDLTLDKTSSNASRIGESRFESIMIAQ